MKTILFSKLHAVKAGATTQSKYIVECDEMIETLLIQGNFYRYQYKENGTILVPNGTNLIPWLERVGVNFIVVKSE